MGKGSAGISRRGLKGGKECIDKGSGERDRAGEGSIEVLHYEIHCLCLDSSLIHNTRKSESISCLNCKQPNIRLF